ncbi:hypothetical protein LguiA_033472 [Lonicera macranthoides]
MNLGSNLPMLKHLYLGGNPISNLSECVRNLGRLEKLDLSWCPWLKQIIWPSINIQELIISECRSLKKITYIRDVGPSTIYHTRCLHESRLCSKRLQDRSRSQKKDFNVRGSIQFVGHVIHHTPTYFIVLARPQPQDIYPHGFVSGSSRPASQGVTHPGIALVQARLTSEFSWDPKPVRYPKGLSGWDNHARFASIILTRYPVLNE